MSLKRWAAKRDESEPEIVETFLDAGCSVIKHSGPGEADLVVGHRGRTRLVEVKSGNAQLKPMQAEWAQAWKGGPVWVCRTAAQARKLVKQWEAELTK